MIDKSELGDVAKDVLKRFEKVKVDPSWFFAECGRRETNKWTHECPLFSHSLRGD
jgi:hypothetical protein